MAWDFSTEPEFEEKLDWIGAFVRDEAEPLDLAFADGGIIYDKSHPVHDEVVRPLQQKVKAQGLWACHLGPELGGKGYGQVKLALMAEILGRSAWAPSLFGCQAPDSGNAEILAHFGSDAQKERYLEPLLEQRSVSCYSMTEPHAGADPRLFNCRAERDGNDWVINGEKFFSSNMRYADFAIVMAITNPDVPVYQGASMFLVPTDTPGLDILRHTGVGDEPEGTGNHPHVRYENVRVPGDALLGGEGQAFRIAQTRLGGGRLHHAMRTVGAAQRCFDMMLERAVSRHTIGGPLSKKQMVQEAIADSWVQLLQFRLQVLHAAWTCDQVGGSAARAEIAGVKVATPKVYHDVVVRAIQLHGALGVSNEMPFTKHLLMSLSLGLADGPTEVHKLTIAKAALKGVEPAEGLWPTEHLPKRRAEACQRFAHLLEHEVGNR
ncbi:MAG: acyl-CoA dehydrogenase family protein [Deltaproteobacteria bacterium]|nr:acyl-CoA dehydrogenase family protein [Deltaproteobacteria bacterium]MBW2361909.1 acyl-CoA dehydrogenase family protein [Deltaproteobacteria bacterium]